MPLRQLESLFEDSVIKSYNKGQLILSAGDELTHIYFVQKGYIKVYTISEQGDERILLIFPSGTAFPVFPSALSDKPYRLRYFYQAMTDAKLYQIPQKQFNDLVNNDEDATRLVLHYVTELAGDLVRRVAMIENKESKNKIASLLHYLIKVCGKELKPDRYIVNLKITHQDIASLTGLTRETASTQVKQLEDEGVVEQTRGRLIINQSLIPVDN